MGAGTLECDVTFTKDLELVCRHAQNDLATTTDILLTPLAQHLRRAVQAGAARPNGSVQRAARAECRTSELTLAEFKTLAARSMRSIPRRRRSSSSSRPRVRRGRISAQASSAARC